MSIASSLQQPVVVYREEQNFAWWIYALLGVMVLLAVLSPTWSQVMGANGGVARGWGLHVPVGLALGLTVPAVLVVGVLRMTTMVTPGDVRVWFGWIPTTQHAVAITDIQRLEVVVFRPIADHGFWGARSSRDGERVFTARGNQGVRLILCDGSRVLIGSQKPEVLAVAIETAMQPPT